MKALLRKLILNARDAQIEQKKNINSIKVRLSPSKNIVLFASVKAVSILFHLYFILFHFRSQDI